MNNEELLKELTKEMQRAINSRTKRVMDMLLMSLPNTYELKAAIIEKFQIYNQSNPDNQIDIDMVKNLRVSITREYPQYTEKGENSYVCNISVEEYLTELLIPLYDKIKASVERELKNQMIKDIVNKK